MTRRNFQLLRVLEVWLKKVHGGDLAVYVAIFILNSSFNPSKGSHEKEAGSNSGSGGGDVTSAEEFQPLTLE
jgi:hypothetical protein